jgi:hypothetical protein
VNTRNNILLQQTALFLIGARKKLIRLLICDNEFHQT